MPRTAYTCLDCQHGFEIEVTAVEATASLDESRTDGCPRCGREVGWGMAHCRACRNPVLAHFGHWHARCDLHDAGACARCGARVMTPCIC